MSLLPGPTSRLRRTLFPMLLTPLETADPVQAPTLCPCRGRFCLWGGGSLPRSWLRLPPRPRLLDSSVSLTWMSSLLSPSPLLNLSMIPCRKLAYDQIRVAQIRKNKTVESSMPWTILFTFEDVNFLFGPLKYMRIFKTKNYPFALPPCRK